jgi:5-carboxymethyl-2-hydroxymuconate isomerase
LGGIDIKNCKSRVLKLRDYYIANGKDNQAFVHLEVKILQGRTEKWKSEIGQALLNILQENYSDIPGSPFLQISIEIVDMKRKSYFKFIHG